MFQSYGGIKWEYYLNRGYRGIFPSIMDIVSTFAIKIP
jgi:hypothetical protein